MFNSPAALRQRLRAISPGSCPPSTTRIFLRPAAPCLVQRRQRSYFSRLLGTGFNSIKSKSRVTKKAVKRTPTPASVARLNGSHAPLVTAEQAKNDIPLIQDTLPSTRPSSSQNHHDLSTYNEFVSRNKVDTESMIYVGTRYEYVVAEALKTWRMRLDRCGGKDDKGIDLVGTWRGFKVLVQCKFGRPMPAFARELEGSIALDERSHSGEVDVLALLASPKPATPAVLQTMQRSSRPMCFIQVSGGGQIINFFRNAAANNTRLADLTQHFIYVPSKDVDGKPNRPRRRVVLSADNWASRNGPGFVARLITLIVMGYPFYWVFKRMKKYADEIQIEKQPNADQPLENIALEKFSALKEIIALQETYKQLGGWIRTSTRDVQRRGWLWTATTDAQVPFDGHTADGHYGSKDKSAAGDGGAASDGWLREMAARRKIVIHDR